MKNVKKYLNTIDKNISKWLENNLDYFDFDNVIYKEKSIDDKFKPFCELCFLSNFLIDELSNQMQHLW